MLSSSRSFRTNDIKELINYNSDYAAVDGLINREADNSEEWEKLRVFISPEQKEYRYNGENINNHEFYTLFGVVSKSNSDMLILRGNPEERRKFLDKSISRIDKKYLRSFLNYRKVLKQRNSLLKKAREINLPQNKLKEEIAPWNKSFSEIAENMINRRMEYLRELDEIVAGKFRYLFDDRSRVVMNYRTSCKKKTKSTQRIIWRSSKKFFKRIT